MGIPGTVLTKPLVEGVNLDVYGVCCNGYGAAVVRDVSTIAEAMKRTIERQSNPGRRYPTETEGRTTRARYSV